MKLTPCRIGIVAFLTIYLPFGISSAHSAAMIVDDTILEWNFDGLNAEPSFKASSIGVSMLSKTRPSITPFEAEDFASSSGIDGTGALVMRPEKMVHFELRNLDPSEVLGIRGVEFSFRSVGAPSIESSAFEFSPDGRFFIELEDGFDAIPDGFSDFFVELGRFENTVASGESVFFSIRSGGPDLILDGYRFIGTANNDPIPEPSAALLLILSGFLGFARRRRS